MSDKATITSVVVTPPSGHTLDPTTDSTLEAEVHGSPTSGQDQNQTTSETHTETVLERDESGSVSTTKTCVTTRTATSSTKFINTSIVSNPKYV